MALYPLPALLSVTYEHEAFLSMSKRPVDTSGGSRPSDKDTGVGGGGGGFGAVCKKIFFRPFGPQFGLKLEGGGAAPRAPPLDPLLDATF